MKKIISILTIMVMILTSTVSPTFAATTSLTTNKTSYAVGEDIIITASGGSADAWVGIYKQGETPGASGITSHYWYYSNGYNDGSGTASYTSGTAVTLQKTTLNTNKSKEIPEGNYVVYLFKDGGYNSVASVNISINSSQITRLSYTLDHQTDGFANGTVTVTLNGTPEANTDCVMFWADNNGNRLSGYTSLAKFKLTGSTTTWKMYDHTIIPSGASKLIAYKSKNNVLIGNPASTTLPSNSTYSLSGNYTEFQLVSDLHVSTGNGPNGVENKHFSQMLSDVKTNSPNSIGIFVNGDITNGGNEEEYKVLTNLYNAAKSSGVVPNLHLAIGNHDLYGGNPNGLFQKYAKIVNSSLASQPSTVYYDETVGGYHFVYLGSEGSGNAATLTTTQLNWLDNRLATFTAENPDKPVFILLHQPLKDTVAGSITSLGQNWHGVATEQQLRAVIKKYDQVIIAGGHSHWELNSRYNMYPGDDNMPVAVNTASNGYLWTDYNVTGGEYLEGSHGYYVRVYSDKVVFMGRNFVTGEYMPSAMFVVQQNSIKTPAESYSVKVGETANLNATFSDGSDVKYASSDTSVVTVSSNGVLTPVKAGTATIYITANATTKFVRNQKIVKVTVTAAHSHTMGNWQIVTAATCDKAGSQMRTCSGCSYTETETIAAKGHTEVIDKAVAATCTTSGKTQGKHCSVCNTVITAQTVIAPKGHTEVIDEAVPVTCTTTGKSEGKHCSTCNTVLIAQTVIAPTGHNKVTDKAVEPTCTETGLTEGQHCTKCDWKIAQTIIPSNGHTEVIDKAVAATCTTDGKTEGKHCSVCKTVIVAQEFIEKQGHKLEAGKTCEEPYTCTVCHLSFEGGKHTEKKLEAIPPTCTKDGLKEGIICSACNTIIVAQEKDPATGHNKITDEAVAPTCTEAGKTEGMHCSKCSWKIEQQPEPALNHNIVTDKAVEPTCTEYGYTKGQHCTRCNDVTIEQEPIKPTGHDIVIDEAVPATCTTTGLTEGMHCSKCSWWIPRSVTPMADHIAVEIPAVAPTCTEAGSTEGIKCAVCKNVITEPESIPKNGHTEVIDKAIPATCSKNGLTEGKHCSVCNVMLETQRETPFAAHKLGAPATCTEPQRCTTCHNVFALPSGHNNIILEAKPATCAQSGYTTGIICTKCDYATLAQKEIPKLPHDYKESITPATFDQDGCVVHQCDCGDVLEETLIPAIDVIKLSKTSYTYNGKVQNPKLILKDNEGNTISADFYTLSKKSGRKNVGKYTYTVEFEGKYVGIKELSFTIKPVKPSIKVPAAAKKAVTVKWNKVSKQTSGYQVIMATNSKFTKNKKSVNVIGASKVSKKMTKLKAKTKYYVKVRSYKTVRGVKYYSDWSAVKTIRTK